MNPFKRKEQRPEVLDFLADAADLTVRQMRGSSGSPEQESNANAVKQQAAGFRRRAAKARKQGS
ncbi:MAG: hypothetical protein ACJ786_21735 [Catenulispora sp.]